MSIQIPEPVAAYQLPDGTFVSSPEEYAARLAEGEAEVVAKAYAVANKGTFQRGQFTRSMNVVKNFLMWKAGQDSQGIDVSTAYAELIAAHDEEELAKSKQKKEEAPAEAATADAPPPPPA